MNESENEQESNSLNAPSAETENVPSEEREEKPKKKKIKIVLNVIFSVFMVICVLLIAFNVYLRAACVCVVVSGDSMKETLHDGDVLFIRKSARPERGDVVVVNVTSYKNDRNFTGDYIIKRVIATEGDSLYCVEHTIYIRYAGTENFVALEESYISDPTGNSYFSTVTVGEGEVFLMGDNRRDSYDSRYIGCVKTEILVGPVEDWSMACKGFFTAYYDLFGLKPQDE